MDLKLKNAVVLVTGGSRGRDRRHLPHRPLAGGIGLAVQY